jgi:hypothetical protein
MHRYGKTISVRRFAAALASAAAAAAFSFGAAIAVAPQANAWPSECTYEQPYPNSPYDICTGFGQSCSRSTCKYPPGTQGEWGTDGHYTPCTRQYGCS